MWTSLESCPLATPHDEAADALLTTAPDTDDDGPGGRWRHADVVDGAVRGVSEHRASAAAVAAYRGVDRPGVRWAEPVAARDQVCPARNRST